jgi:hypothetical protein
MTGGDADLRWVYESMILVEVRAGGEVGEVTAVKSCGA